MSEDQDVQLVINGNIYNKKVAANRTLLKFLREDMELTGTKNGCSQGNCGSCTVLINNKPAKACLEKVVNLAGSTILTIEGLSVNGELHPIQKAFIQAGAVQCGFCTPGMILTAKALLDSNPQPSRDEIVNYFSSNLCRCTGYFSIIEAVNLAAQYLFSNESEG